MANDEVPLFTSVKIGEIVSEKVFLSAVAEHIKLSYRFLFRFDIRGKVKFVSSSSNMIFILALSNRCIGCSLSRSTKNGNGISETGEPYAMAKLPEMFSVEKFLHASAAPWATMILCTFEFGGSRWAANLTPGVDKHRAARDGEVSRGAASSSDLLTYDVSTPPLPGYQKTPFRVDRTSGFPGQRKETRGPQKLQSHRRVPCRQL